MRETLRNIEQVLKGDNAVARDAAARLRESAGASELLALVAQEFGAEIRVSRDGLQIADGIVLPNTAGLRVRGIKPAHYEISLATGRVLWSRKVEAREVRWAVAHPGVALPAAAQSEVFEVTPTLRETVAGGNLHVEVFAGREAGTLVIRR